MQPRTDPAEFVSEVFAAFWDANAADALEAAAAALAGGLQDRILVCGKPSHCPFVLRYDLTQSLQRDQSSILSQQLGILPQ
jgi:hypothetical protein